MVAGETAESLSMQLKAVPLIKALFADVNPIPVKWAMNRLGWECPATAVCRSLRPPPQCRHSWRLPCRSSAC